MTAKRFKAVRRLLGVTQDEFAEMMGYSSGKVISHKETGFRAITLRDERLLAAFLEVRKVVARGGPISRP